MRDSFVALDLDRTLFDTMTYAEQIAQGTGAPFEASTLRMRGADELLEMLVKKGISFGVMTYGPVAVQVAKLQAAGFERVPYMVVDNPVKSELINAWRQSDGTYAIPVALAGEEGLVVRRVILVDDKAIAFQGVAPGVEGFLFRPDGVEVLEQQKGDVPASVQVLHRLVELPAVARL